MLRENHAVILGKNINFRGGGGINIRFRPKYRPLKKSQNIRNQGFPLLFLLDWLRCGRIRSLIRTCHYGSGNGSRRPKNIRIPRIRIRNTGTFTFYKKSERSHKTVEINVFLAIFAWWWDGRIRSRIRTCQYRIRMRIREARNIRILQIRIWNTTL